MPQFKYNVQSLLAEDIRQGAGISSQDKSLLTEYQVNSPFEPFQNSIELHIYSLDGSLIQSEYRYNDTVNFGPVDQNSKTPRITLNPETDAVNRGYEYGDVRLLYHFVDDAFTSDQTTADFYIEEISIDRTELRLLTTRFDNQTIQDRITSLKAKIDSTSNFTDLRLNFGDDRLLLVTNIATQNYNGNTSIVIKLYEPLPTDIVLKQQTYVQELVADSIGFQVDAEVIPDEIIIPYIKGPNFGIALDNQSTAPSEYLSYDDLYTEVANNTNRQYQTILKEKGVQLSIDYSDYANFINFSSAVERLQNFEYKLNLINSYQDDLDSINSSTNPNSGSKDYYQSLIDGVISGFDHYDRFLYFESSSYSWPKQNSEIPYINATGSAITTWYAEQYTSASLYDDTNPHRLINTIPGFVSDDTRNQPYITFIEMVAQHFDNVWLYSKAVTDKYDADNRLNHGISKDLVEEALRNFGVKLYNSNKNTEELFKMFTSGFYQTGSEQITTFISASDIPTSEDNYRKEIYKRLYHNLPLLTKAKGTERGLRALINSFGIPTLYSSGSHNGLKIKTTGGGSSRDNVYLGPARLTTSSLGDISTENYTTNLTGSTLSQYTSIVERDRDRTPDTHTVHIGFSPTDSVDTFIETALTASGFNIDELIGDPSLESTDRYTELFVSASQILTNNRRYDLQDFTRLLKFYDNVFFKTVKDFVPARSNVTTGVIVKPHILERNKAKQVQATTQQKYGNSTQVGLFEDNIILTSSIDVETYEGSHGESYPQGYSTAYTASIITPDGTVNKIIDSEEAKFNGELSGSTVNAKQSNSYDLKILFGTPENINLKVTEAGGASEEWELSVNPGELRFRDVGSHSDPFYRYIIISTQDVEGTSIKEKLDIVQTVEFPSGELYTLTSSLKTTDYYRFTFPETDNYTGFTVVPSEIAGAEVVDVSFDYGPNSVTTTNLPNPIEANAIDGRKSVYIQDVNRSTGETSPNNLSLILDDSQENLADVADWRYSSIGYGSGRYYGSKTSEKSFGQQPAVSGYFFQGQLYSPNDNTVSGIQSQSWEERQIKNLRFFNGPGNYVEGYERVQYPKVRYVRVENASPYLSTGNYLFHSSSNVEWTSDTNLLIKGTDVSGILVNKDTVLFKTEDNTDPGYEYMTINSVYYTNNTSSINVTRGDYSEIFSYFNQDYYDLKTSSRPNQSIYIYKVAGDIVGDTETSKLVQEEVTSKKYVWIRETSEVLYTNEKGKVINTFPEITPPVISLPNYYAGPGDPEVKRVVAGSSTFTITANNARSSTYTGLALSEDYYSSTGLGYLPADGQPGEPIVATVSFNGNIVENEILFKIIGLPPNYSISDSSFKLQVSSSAGDGYEATIDRNTSGIISASIDISGVSAPETFTIAPEQGDLSITILN